MSSGFHIRWLLFHLTDGEPATRQQISRAGYARARACVACVGAGRRNHLSSFCFAVGASSRGGGVGGGAHADISNTFWSATVMADQHGLRAINTTPPLPPSQLTWFTRSSTFFAPRRVWNDRPHLQHLQMPPQPVRLENPPPSAPPSRRIWGSPGLSSSVTDLIYC